MIANIPAVNRCRVPLWQGDLYRLGVASLAALVAFGSPTLAQASKIELPDPGKTDPVVLKLMKDFPPPADKIVTLANTLNFPNARWAYHHLRELGPTVAVWRGEMTPASLPTGTHDLDAIAIDSDTGDRTTIGDWQRDTYTDGLLVLHKGRIVYERYYSGMKPHQPHTCWSVTKSFVGLLATLLIHEGRIDANAKITTYLPELVGSAWGDATVQQALDMTTAVGYAEVFTDPKSDVFQYLFATGLIPLPAGYAGPRSTYQYLKTLKKNGEHGQAFQYRSVDTEVIGWLLQRVTGKSFSELLSERIWQQLGAQEDAYAWVDPQGAQITSIGLSSTMRDLARFGEMLRLGGQFAGRTVLPKAVVDEIRKGGDREKFKAAGMTARTGYSYHNHWWIAHDADGTFEAKGLNGQHIHINPAADIVIIKFSSHVVGNTIFTHVVDRNAFEALAKAVRE